MHKYIVLSLMLGASLLATGCTTQKSLPDMVRDAQATADTAQQNAAAAMTAAQKAQSTADAAVQKAQELDTAVQAAEAKIDALSAENQKFHHRRHRHHHHRHHTAKAKTP